MLALSLFKNMTTQTDNTFLLDEFVTTRTGTPYRLFPFGTLVKGGRTREITPDMAGKFRLPHFKPAIKLGSHYEPTPAGGHIIALEVREDGLYAVPEWNEKGEQALEDGAYRYHSPEVIWEDGALEDPTTGRPIPGPLILGDALLHMPHLGEAAALYSVGSTQKEQNTMTEAFEFPQTFWDKLGAILKPAPVEPKPAESEEYQAVVVERDQYKAELDAFKAELAQNALVNELTSKLQDKEQFGMSFIELKGAQEAAGVLAGMSPEQRDWVMRNFKALAAQSDALTSEIGDNNGAAVTDDPISALDAAVRAKQAESKLDYSAALNAVTIERPELLEAYQQKRAKE